MHKGSGQELLVPEWQSLPPPASEQSSNPHVLRSFLLTSKRFHEHVLHTGFKSKLK